MGLYEKSDISVSASRGFTARRGRIAVKTGDAAGVSMSVGHNEKLRVGRDRRSCELVLTENNISRLHCLIEFDAVRNGFVVTDVSTNGVYEREQRLPPHIPVLFAPGTVLALGNRRIQIELI